MELINKYGKDNIDFIFCDTGCEDDDTYRFIRDCAVNFDINITCLKLIMPPEAGQGATYKVCTVHDIKRDHFAWKQLTSKYGNPFMPAGKFCTQQMKGVIYSKYCNDTYGRGNYYTWIGYRFEEGNRIWGKNTSNMLGKIGLDNIEKTEFYLECKKGNKTSALERYIDSGLDREDYEKVSSLVDRALDKIEKTKFRFLPELSTLDKNGVIAWWSSKDFDLRIDKHLMNCLFCIEKPTAVVMLAIKDRPREAAEFLEVLENRDVAVKIKKNGDSRDNSTMYRKGVTFRWMYNKAQSMDREELLEMSRIGQELANKNPCSSGECNPFTDLDDVDR